MALLSDLTKTFVSDLKCIIHGRPPAPILSIALFARGFELAPKSEVNVETGVKTFPLPLMFKWKTPRSYTSDSIASAFSRPELEASILTMCWRVNLNEAEIELVPRKPLWFLPGDSFPMIENAVTRLV